jgi:hypothetical protein
MDVSENGDLMRFTGDVDVYLVPQSASSAPTEAAPAASAGSTAGPKTRQ